MDVDKQQENNKETEEQRLERLRTIGFQPGQSGNEKGRPKGKTMKEYAREYYALKTDDEKKKYIEWLDEKKPGFAWTMGEGNPANATDITSGGQPLNITFDNSFKEDATD